MASLMTRYARVAVLLAIFCALSVQAETTAGDLYVVGQAYDQTSGSIAYREFHFCSADALRCSIEYKNPEGKLIARKDLDYRHDLHAPEINIHDVLLAQRQTIAAQREDGLVVDAGFDNFVRSNWDKLVTGEAIKFRFLVVGRKQPFTMRAQLDESRSCPQQELCLSVALDSWLLGMLADPIDLTYSREDRRLKRFQGVSNIRTESGKTQDVDIQYDYETALVSPPA